jgi:hypothetical protein
MSFIAILTIITFVGIVLYMLSTNENNSHKYNYKYIFGFIAAGIVIYFVFPSMFFVGPILLAIAMPAVKEWRNTKT